MKARTRRTNVAFCPFAIAFAALVMLGSCRCPSRETPADRPIDPPAVVCANAALSHDAFCMPTGVEHWLWHAPLRVLDGHTTAQGTSKPQRLRVEVDPAHREPLTMHVKWKTVPPSGDESNNTPRRELAAYQLQKLLFPNEEGVVPPVVLRCLPLPQRWAGEGALAFPATRCMLGAVAYWLVNVEEMEDIDRVRFQNDPEYRRNVQHLNLFTILAAQRDSAGLNFLQSTDPQRPRVFSVDNTMTFGAFAYNPLSWFSDEWLEVRVAALPRADVDRLRALKPQAFDSLAVVADMVLRDGVLVPNDTPSRVLDPHAGVRRQRGGLQLGLTRTEIDELRERRRALLQRIDRGEIALD